MHLLLAGLLAVIAQSAASVDGVVVKAGSREPLAEAKVQLNPERPPDDFDDTKAKSYEAKTGPDGKFIFNDVAPGVYRLIATRTNGGYIPAEYGQRNATSEGMPLIIAAGQKLTGIQLPMASSGSISGRIYDEDGEPVARAQVSALRPVYKDGHRVLTNVQTVETNDRGEYRLFWLAPGRYYVSAKPDIPQLPADLRTQTGTISAVHISSPTRFGTSEQAAGPVIHKRRLKTGQIVEETYLPVLYPGVLTEQGAIAIGVVAGTAAGGVDMSISAGLAPVRHIRGRVINPAAGQSLAGTRVTVVPRTQSSFVVVPSGSTDSSGEFDVTGLTAGSYWAFATRDRMLGIVSVEVGNMDLQNVTIPIAPAFNLSGRYTFDGRSRSGDQPPLWSLRLAPLVREDYSPGMPIAGPFYNPPPDDDGSFTVEGVYMGDFHVTVFGVPQNAYVKSMRMGDVDVLGQGLHLSRPPENPLNVVIGVNAGSVSGSVANAKQEAQPGCTVVLVPDIRNRQRRDLYKVAMTDSSGQFRMQGITPGEYTLFAWDNVETGAWQDPEFLGLYETQGTSVHIAEGDSKSVPLVVIP
jgi:hypothetical protein